MRAVLAAIAALLTAAEGRLVKVIALGRHGNRAPNPQVPYVCPNVAGLLEQFDEPIYARQRAALSRVGMAENWEAGRFLRQRYGEGDESLLPKTFRDDGSSFFFSERMNRNIASTEALVLGLFPTGTGQEGFLQDRPNLVPILTSQPFEDTLINLPRDGPCKSRYNADRAAWDAENEHAFIKENWRLLSEFSQVCGFDFTNPREFHGKSLAWTMKAAVDAFVMARNEGIDVSMGGTLRPELLADVIRLGANITTGQRFKHEHQITYWVGRFADDALIANMQPSVGHLSVVGQSAGKKIHPWADTAEEWFYRNRLQVYVNHRELFVALAELFGVKELLETPLPAGSMLLWELHEDTDEATLQTKKYIKVLSWRPSQPSWEDKHERLKTRRPVADLYSTGSFSYVHPEACGGEECTVEAFQAALWKWTNRTGTWQQVCGLTDSLTEYAREQRVMEEDGDDFDGWRHAFERSLFPSPLREAKVALPAPINSLAAVMLPVATAIGVMLGYAVASRGRRNVARPASDRGLYGSC
eukprot:TRINITY_DN2420_c0_g1_i1.p1 TRINITY_DN2420_c0_g1~~TRINITY_DN2420_c0_g1_i1.p1  ORF type:complete len:549 (+),score=196.56 TRINITY_DN2420_c0_g1_i1:63-1649(+)